MIELYMGKGLDEPSARRVVEILSKNREAFVDIMMAEELGISIADASEVPWKHGLVLLLYSRSNVRSISHHS